MKQVHLNLFVGSDSDCTGICQDTVIIHACKTCHKSRLNYDGSLPQTHPHYLIFCDGSHLFLNIVDSDRLPNQFGDPLFSEAITFIQNNIKTKKVIIHCNIGQSRSPAIALLYLAKTGIISKETYLAAEAEFKKIYPLYNPGRGIRNYLQINWERLTSGN